ncbi:MAG: type II toxin-antitoxin system Phd/YefM family antitoxin [Alphaproteobacteria bacterium]|nr:type II toxin-antitoxin system Phd/YefM family antitoxin [Alphaproteobacteria bacterium]
MIQISAGEFKAKCLKLMDLAEQEHETIVISKQGKFIAKLVPYEEFPPKLFGFLKGSVHIEGDIIHPLKESWDAEEA